MNRIKRISEALETKCQTPDVIFNIHIADQNIDINLQLPKSLDIDEVEAELLEKNLHNALELVLAKYFKS